MASDLRPSTDLVLGLDIGVASVGWAVLDGGADSGHRRLLALGAHLFEAGTEGSQLDIQSGRDVARSQQRRTARLMRRQTWRRARRKRLLLGLLIKHGLLPTAATPLKRPLDIDAYLKGVDSELRRAHLRDASHADHQRLAYLLRAKAAQHRVELHEFGRALYHLAQRRGFLSNRRAEAAKKKDEDTSVVKAAIGDLQKKIDVHSPATLGAYLASLDPDETRLRGRWTARAMYLAEFDCMWKEQAKHHALSEEARREIAAAIFHQRPLKTQSNLIGRCSCIPGERRAPIAHRTYQRFRVFQTINNLDIAEPGRAPRRPTAEEREILLNALLIEGDVTFARAKKLMRLPKGAVFNLEEGGEKRIVGHRSDAHLREAFGARLETFSESDRDRMVEDLRSFRLPEALARRGVRRWGLSSEQATIFAGLDLEEGYAPLSLEAVRRLMPLLEEGVRFGEARRRVFPESFKADTPLDELPPVLKALEDLRNPAVNRALTEVRRLVNAIVRKYGKPWTIRVELARELKNPRSIRDKISRTNREREARREQARARILKEMGIANPTREDVDKVLLADECGWHCPYTGRTFGMTELVGRTSQFDVEHIWPRSRSLDDSFLNKTICYHEENRSRKRGNTPFETYSADAAGWAVILERVQRFKGDPYTRREKYRRFTAERIDDDFTNRHLSDTRFIAKAAAEYLALLYGGRADESGRQRVQVCTGGLTAWLRTGWGIADLLGENGEKNREDHRHHAIDAVVVALSEPRSVQMLARAAESADREFKRRAFEQIDEPWAGFRDLVESAVGTIVVSHRQSRKVAGPLHDQSIYSKPIDGRHRVRKELFKLTPSEIAGEQIIDKRALAAIRSKLEVLGKAQPSKQDIKGLFSNSESVPLVVGAGGRSVRLRKVRLAADTGRLIGAGASARFVQPENNHHTRIVAELDAQGRDRSWEDEPVMLLDAYARQAAGRAIVDRAIGPGKRFVFSLAPGEFLEMDLPGDATKRAIFRVASISKGDMELKLHMDARTADDIKKAKARIRVSGERLRKLRATKVQVTYLGEVRRAGG